MAGNKLNQIKALFCKDLILLRRYFIWTLLEIVAPILIIWAGSNLAKIFKKSLSEILYSGSSLGDASFQLTRIEIQDFPKKCFFTPTSSRISELLSYIENRSDMIEFVYTESEANMVNISQNTYDNVTGLVFNSSTPELNFTFRATAVEHLEAKNWNHFISLHWAITSFDLKDQSNMEPYLNQPPFYDTLDRKRSGSKSEFNEITILVIVLNIVTIIPCFGTCTSIMTEMREGLKELLRLMGVADWIYWSAKLFQNLVKFLILVPIMTLIIYDAFGDNLLKDIPILAFMIMLLALFISNLFIMFIITAFFVVPILVQLAILFFFLYDITKEDSSSSSSIVGMFLIPRNLFGGWLESYTSQTSDRSMSFIAPILIIPFWMAYTFILLYVDGVVPWQKGTVRSLWFPCSITGKRIDPESIEFEIDCDPKLVEKVAGEGNIVCSKVTKVFTCEEKSVVNNVSLKVIKNSITVLLGHNGAGKTTLMNMITGFITPTSGKICVNGYNIQTDMEAAREGIALCPQHNCSFDDLTVEEHFRLFGNLGGSNPELINRTIQFLKLGDKSSSYVKDLSGGMRRRVQLGIALVTDSDTLILDEPTSGLDPETRRVVWDNLILLREKKTILITTHFMEEAEALADQIIIMSTGRIKCIGSQIFLKTRLGAGYSVRMEKKSFNHDATVSLMAQFYPKAAITNDTSEEITFNLGIDNELEKESSSLDSIAQFCDTLDEKKEALGISSYTITTATLEDVFMKVAVDEGRVDEDKVTFAQVKDTTVAELRETLDYDQEKGSSSFCSCYLGLLRKRWLFLGRHKMASTISFAYPLLLIMSHVKDSMIPEGVMEASNFSGNVISPNLYSEKLSVILSASPYSLLAECFKEINSQYNVKIITIDEPIEEYLKKSRANVSSSAYLFGIEDQGTEGNITLYGTDSRPFSKPIVVNNYLNILRCAGTGERTLINTQDHDFPNRISYSKFLEKSSRQRGRFLSSLTLPLTYFFGSMYIYPGLEVEKKSDFVQRMAGAGDLAYWLSSLTFDILYYTVVSAMFVLAMAEKHVIVSNIFEIILILFVAICYVELPLVYLLTFTRMGSIPGQSFVTFFSAIFGAFGEFIQKMDISVSSSDWRQGWIQKLILLIGIFPSARIIIDLGMFLRISVITHTCDSMRHIFEEQYKKQEKNFDVHIKKYCLDGVKPNYFQLFLPHLMLLLTFGTILFIIVIITSKHGNKLSGCIYNFCDIFFTFSRPKDPEERGDEDVLQEKERTDMIVKNKAFTEEALVAHKLTKDFYISPCNCRGESIRAVHDVSFTVHKKECFGLLGVNGAGKTTTFAMLTGDERITRGHGYISELEVTRDLVKYREHFSYCPQEDGLIDLLTPEETLALFARLRGIPGKNLNKNIDYIISKTDLKDFRKTINSNLSGGNKRKLGLAIATIGGPEIMFLDEPTTGVDPASRRKIWGTLIGLRESGRSSVIMTSHSMDECEAICNRIAIMAKGQIRCLGSSTHLKSKYGQGFTLIIKLKEESAVAQLREYIKNPFPSARLQDQHGTTIQFHLPDPNLRWGGMFRSMKQVKENIPIDNFYIHDTSIEQIFLSFAHQESSQNE